MEQGIIKKYIISKADGTPVDPDAEYFVLRLDTKGDAKHTHACRQAIIRYAQEIEPHSPLLAEELLNKYQ